MTKSTKSTKISAAFLATVLIAGIIAVISPSILAGAQAEPYGMDDNKYKKSYGYDDYKSKYDPKPKYPSYPHDDYKSKYDPKPKYPSYPHDDYKSKDVIVKKIKCTNFNLNVNGLSVNVGSPEDDSIATAGAASTEGNQPVAASSLGNSEGNHFKKFDKDFVFICFSINNNQGAGGGGGGGDGNEVNECEKCFDPPFLTAEQKADVVDTLKAGFTINYPGQIPDDEVFSIQELCESFDEFADNFGTIQSNIVDLLTDAGVSASLANDISKCIADALGI